MQQEELEQDTNDGAQSTPPPGGAAVGRGGAPSLSVVPVSSDDRIDDVALQFLHQSLLARTEEEKAREDAEVKELEEVVAQRMQRLEARS